MSLSKDKELNLNAKYAWLRRAVISYYAKCMSDEKSNNNFYEVPSSFQDMMQFVSDIFYGYLKDEYKDIVN